MDNNDLENLVKIDLASLNYDPTKTPIWEALQEATVAIIKKDKERGLVYESKVRWDEVDQKEFDKLPLEKLIDDPYYGGGKYYLEQVGDITQKHPGLWPVHRQDILDLYAEKKTHGKEVFVDIEGIGSGKTHKFRTILRIELLRVLTRVDPLTWYGLDPKGQGISFVCMSRNAKLAKEVTFNTVLKAFDCEFFNTYFPPQVDLEKIKETSRYPAILRFPKDVVIFPGSGSALSAIGYNLMGGGVDEANYLEVVEGSKKAWSGKDYDAAEIMYNAIYDRMFSRFSAWKAKHNCLPGILMLFSNTRHQGDFLERMALRSRTKGSTIFTRRRCTWQGHPSDEFCGEVFYFDIVNRCICTADGTPIFNRIKGAAASF